MANLQKITPFLWFQHEAEQAASLYVSLLPDSKILHVQRNGDAVLAVDFQLAGQRFTALNGNPARNFSEAFSLLVQAETQEEVDRLWSTLTAEGGAESKCGWLKDRYGVSWQIVPTRFMQLIRDPDGARVQRVFAAMMTMRKFDIAALERAYAG